MKSESLKETLEKILAELQEIALQGDYNLFKAVDNIKYTLQLIEYNNGLKVENNGAIYIKENQPIKTPANYPLKKKRDTWGL